MGRYTRASCDVPGKSRTKGRHDTWGKSSREEMIPQHHRTPDTESLAPHKWGSDDTACTFQGALSYQLLRSNQPRRAVPPVDLDFFYSETILQPIRRLSSANVSVGSKKPSHGPARKARKTCRAHGRIGVNRNGAVMRPPANPNRHFRHTTTHSPFTHGILGFLANFHA